MEFLASAGMGVLIAAQDELAPAIRFAVVADGPATSRPLKLVGVTDVVDLYATLDEALDRADELKGPRSGSQQAEMADSGQRDSRTRFAHTNVLADAACAAQIRQEFSVWLKRYFALDATKVSDVVLAVNEALANAAEFAYSARRRARRDAFARRLRQRYSRPDGHRDRRGRLAHRGLREEEHSRGRGIPLMRALADRATIDSSASGTRVRLEWNHVAAAQSAVT